MQHIIFTKKVQDSHLTVWKNAKFTFTEKIFRQINYLVISLVKPLLSRNFCQKCMRVNFRNFHNVHLRSQEVRILGEQSLF